MATFTRVSKDQYSSLKSFSTACDLIGILAKKDCEEQASKTKYMKALGVHHERELFPCAVKILNHAAWDGNRDQKNDLKLMKGKIKKFNRLTRSSKQNSLEERLDSYFGIDRGAATDLLRLKIYRKSGLKKVLLKISQIFRVSLAVLTEIPTIIFAGMISVFARVNMDPAVPIRDPSRPPVLFLHGLAHNQSGWIVGKAMLRLAQCCSDKKHGSFYSISYANIFSNDAEDTFDSYAEEALCKCLQIKRETGQMPIIIGHSMGGLVGTLVAKKANELIELKKLLSNNPFKPPENPPETEEDWKQLNTAVATYLDEHAFMHESRTELGILLEILTANRYLDVLADVKEPLESFVVKDIITLGTPFYGSRVADGVHYLRKHILGIGEIQVQYDLRPKSQPLKTVRDFAKKAEARGSLNFYNVGTTTDEFVPSGYRITHDTRKFYELHAVGHLGMTIDPFVWRKINRWLLEIYEQRQA